MRRSQLATAARDSVNVVGSTVLLAGSTLAGTGSVTPGGPGAVNKDTHPLPPPLPPPPHTLDVPILPMDVGSIKEEMPEPDIQAEAEVSLDESHALAQVLEDFPNDEAPPPEPEVQIRAAKIDDNFRKLTAAESPPKVVHVQMGNITYQISDQLFKSGALNGQNPNLLSKDQLEQMITDKDPELVYRKHHNNNSTWQRYMPMFYKGIKQNYVRCLECGWLVLHKASTGTGSLLRHRCKIKLATGVEVKLEPQPASTRNMPLKAPKSGGLVPAAVKFPTVVTPLPQNVKDDLIRQQACVVYKDMVTAELFDLPSFRTLAQMLVNIGVYYGQQEVSFLASKECLVDAILPVMYEEAKGQLNKALAECDLSFSYNFFRNEFDRRNYVTINAYTVAADYYYRQINIKTVEVSELSHQCISQLPRVIEEGLNRTFGEPLKFVVGPESEAFPADNVEPIPCVVSALWNIMKRIMEMLEYDHVQYVERTYFRSVDDAEEDAMDRFLEPFREPIRSLISDTNATISEVVLWKKKLEQSFKIEDDDEEEVKAIKDAFQVQIRQGLKMHDYHRIAVFLDPKFKGLRFLTEEERNETITIVKLQLSKDQDGIERVTSLYTNGTKKPDAQVQAETKFYEFMDCSLKIECDDVVDDEIRQYVDVKLENPIDILSYWRTENSFPLLKRLCRRVLNIPAACDDMKLLFGQTGRDFQRRRLMLSDKELDMVMYLRQNSPSRDRFLESSQQIEALVERFARETPIPEAPINPIGSGKIPLAYGKPGELKVWGILYLRLLAATFSCGYAGLRALFLRLLALPAAMGLLWLFYNQIGDDSHGFFSKTGLIMNILALSYGVGIWTTITLFPAWRKRFCQEYSEGLYSGATLLIAYNAVSIPFSFISAALGACALYPMILNPTNPDGMKFAHLLVALWTSFMLAEQLCITFLLVMKSQINAAIAVSYILIVCLSLASGTIRSHKGLSSWLQENTKGVHTKYASSLLHTATFLDRNMNCTPANGILCPQPADFLMERMGKATPQETTDIAASVAFALGLCAFNMILYLLPMPRCVRRKFRD